MSAERQGRAGLLGLSLAMSLLAGVAAAQDAPPDADFLEYLGAWDATDEDWMLFGGPARESGDEDAEPAPAEDEDATESNDEG